MPDDTAHNPSPSDVRQFADGWMTTQLGYAFEDALPYDVQVAADRNRAGLHRLLVEVRPSEQQYGLTVGSRGRTFDSLAWLLRVAVRCHQLPVSNVDIKIVPPKGFSPKAPPSRPAQRIGSR